MDRRILIPALFLTSLLFAFTACGNSGDRAFIINSPMELTAAVDNTKAEQSAKFELTVDMNLSAVGQTQQLQLNGNGAINYQSNQGTFKGEIPASGFIPQVGIEEVIDGTTLYAKTTVDGASLTAKPWVKLDLSQLQSNDLTSLTQKQTNPSQYLNLLQSNAKNIKRVGSESVRGTDTTHYTMEVDFPQVGSIPAEIWVDSDGRVRRVTVNLDLENLNLGGIGQAFGPVSGFVKATQELYDFGTTFNVEIPPADQITEAPSLNNIL